MHNNNILYSSRDKEGEVSAQYHPDEKVSPDITPKTETKYKTW